MSSNTVNHSQRFVDPSSDTHTLGIKSIYPATKMSIKLLIGYSHHNNMRPFYKHCACYYNVTAILLTLTFPFFQSIYQLDKIIIANKRC